MPLEKPPCPPHEALFAFGVHSAKRCQYLAIAGSWRFTGLLSQARLYRTPEQAESVAAHLRDEFGPEDWAVVPAFADILPPRNEDEDA